VTEEPLLKVEDLTIAFSFEGRRSVPVRGVSFEIPRASRVAIVGESGCGKSLTALQLAGLVERAEVSGRVSGAAKIAYIFQNPMESLDPVMKVGRQITEGTGKTRGDAEALLAAVGLPAEAAGRYPCELSGGQRQRVMIAAALAQEPDLIVADEPTTALDVTTQREVLDLIERVADRRGTAVLLITHNLALVAKYSRYVNVMYAGEIVERGPVDEVLAHPRHPYTEGLLAAVPRLDLPRDAVLADIPGTVPPPWDWPVGCAFHPRCGKARPECSRPEFSRCPEMDEDATGTDRG
jgi:oligopeptide/dipeptide ABC transporter ATP-binding protein